MMEITEERLQIIDKQYISLSKYSYTLSLFEDDGEVYLFCESDNREKEKVRVMIEMFGTGEKLNPDVNRKFIGTVKVNGVIRHFYEKLSQ